MFWQNERIIFVLPKNRSKSQFGDDFIIFHHFFLLEKVATSLNPIDLFFITPKESVSCFSSQKTARPGDVILEKFRIYQMT